MWFKPVRRHLPFVLLTCALALPGQPARAGLADAAPQPYGWHEIPGTQIQGVCPPDDFQGSGYPYSAQCKNVTRAWSSAALDTTRNRLLIWGGGHNDYYGNEVYAIDLETQAVRRLTDPAPPADPNAPQRASELAPHDGSQPNSRHTYDALAYIEHADRVWAFSGALAGVSSASMDRSTWLFDPGAAAWQLADASGDIPNAIPGVASAYDPVTGLVYLHDRSYLYSYAYDAAGGEYRRLTGSSALGLGTTAAIDPVRRRFIAIGRGQFVIYDLSEPGAYVRVNPPQRGATAVLEAQAPGLAYDPGLDRMVAWIGDGRIYLLDPDTLEWEDVAFRGGPGLQHGQGTYDRWSYVPDLQAFVVYNEVTDNAFTFRPLVGVSDTTPPAAVPTPQVAQRYPGSVELSWTEPTDDIGVEGYHVYRDGALVAEPPFPEYKELHLTPGASYGYHVVAYDSAGNVGPPSPTVTVSIPANPTPLPLGDCSSEPGLAGRDDIAFCEPWEHNDWWTSGYLRDPIVAAPRAALSESVDLTSIVQEGCLEGSCLRVDTPAGVTRSLSVYWPLTAAGLAPRNLQVRYYLKLGETWDPLMCDAEGNVVGAGGKFPGPADVRTWADPGGQCGNGGAASNGRNCWSARSNYRACGGGDGLACSTKPNAIARFGSYLYHGGQASSTGDAGYWDAHIYGSSSGGGGDCETNPSNFRCGRGDGGVLERGRWYQVEIQTTMNTPGQADGVIRGWIDGVLSFEKTNMSFREEGHDLLHNRLVWLNVYKGGRYGNCSNGEVYLDQMVVGTGDPIGGLDTDTPRPPAITLALSDDNPSPGDLVSVSWLSKDALTCEASGAWTGPRALAGTEVVEVPAEGGEVRMTCLGSGGETVRARVLASAPTAADSSSAVSSSHDGIAPSVPADLRVAQSGPGAVTLEWSPSTDNVAVSRYRVFLGDLPVAAVAAPVYVHGNLPAGAQPAFSVAALDAAGNLSAPSAAVSITVDGSGNTAGPSQSFTFLPVSDSYVSPTTRKTLEAQDSVLVNPRHNGLIAFPLALPPGAVVTRATLELHSVHQYAAMRLGVFTPARAWHEAAASWYEVDTATGEAWDNEGGDWIDAAGTAQGEVPFAAEDLPYSGTPFSTELEVTDLVRGWQDGSRTNTGFFLRSVADGGHGQRFGSSNGDLPPPRLHVEYQVVTGEIVVEASADAYLHASTSRSLGAQGYFDLSPASPVLLRFDLPQLPAGTAISSARLELYKLRDYYTPLPVGVFGAARDWSEYAVTRDYADVTQGRAWEQQLGDWADVQGTMHGGAPFATAYLEAHGRDEQWVQIDVGSLVSAWVDGAQPNNGVYLRALAGGNTHRYASRESGSSTGLEPRLVIELAN